MKNRKKGFSLVELLIVLAVIAALIATITPVAMNAIRKSQATKVAQNMKTLAAAIENAAYVNGVKSGKIQSGPDEELAGLSTLGRDIEPSKYQVSYAYGNGKVYVAVVTSEEVDEDTARSVVFNLADWDETAFDDFFQSYTPVDLDSKLDAPTLFYTFTFDVY